MSDEVPQIPAAKLPSWNVPTIRSLPTIPTVGCVTGNATTLIGSQMGNLPDAMALPHVKALDKIITEQIGTLIEGKLPDLLRAPLYQVRQLRLFSELAQIISTSAQLAAQIQAETNAVIEACNQKIDDLNAAKDAILQIPENARTVVQQKALDRYNEYAGEINAQIGRLQQSLGCLN
jgi:hypothetical protein